MIVVNVAASVVRHPAILADILITVPAAYWFLIARPRGQSPWTVLPVMVLGAFRATFLFPTLPAKEWIAGACELALIAMLFVAPKVLPPGVARVLRAELSIFWFALFSWGSRPDVPEGARAYWVRESSRMGDVITIGILGSFLEVVPMHLLVGMWSPAAAWVLTGLTVYGVLWLIALHRSIALRPVVVSDDQLLVRFGMLWTLRIPRADVERVSSEPISGALRIPGRAQPQCWIEFKTPLQAEGPYGIRKRVSAIALAVDDPAGFHF